MRNAEITVAPAFEAREDVAGGVLELEVRLEEGGGGLQPAGMIVLRRIARTPERVPAGRLQHAAAFVDKLETRHDCLVLAPQRDAGAAFDEFTSGRRFAVLREAAN